MTPTRCFAASILLLMPQIYADDVAVQGRAVYDRYKDAVVTVQVTVSISQDGEEYEDRDWSNGTVVAPDGTTVLPLSYVDPASVWRKMASPEVKFETRVLAMAIIRADGTSTPAVLALRDEDLDLAVIRPATPPDSPVPHVDLLNPGQPELLDHVVQIAQLGEVARRAHSVTVYRIECIVEKPIRYYLFAHAAPSNPVFTLGGAFVGIGVVRTIESKDEIEAEENTTAIVLSAGHIRDILAHLAPPLTAPDASPAPAN